MRDQNRSRHDRPDRAQNCPPHRYDCRVRKPTHDGSSGSPAKTGLSSCRLRALGTGSFLIQTATGMPGHASNASNAKRLNPTFTLRHRYEYA